MILADLTKFTKIGTYSIMLGRGKGTGTGTGTGVANGSNRNINNDNSIFFGVSFWNRYMYWFF
jgi:hypothetical protein